MSVGWGLERFSPLNDPDGVQSCQGVNGILCAVDDRTWLDVPFDEKDAAKQLGARWDPGRRRWYAPQDKAEALARWAPLPDIPLTLPGEDRDFGAGLFVDLVPSSCWFTNARSCIHRRDWERVRRMVLQRAAERCEACGRGEDRDVRRWLEVHERWEYDVASLTQVLRRLICLCSDCHGATHFGLAQIRGVDSKARMHLINVRKETPTLVEAHISDAFRIWRERSLRDWRLDLQMLTQAGIQLNESPQASSRREIARERLRRT